LIGNAAKIDFTALLFLISALLVWRKESYDEARSRRENSMTELTRRKLTRGQFDQLECNRCGACCEKLLLPSPLKLVEALGARAREEIRGDEWNSENQRFIAWLSDLEPTGHEVNSGDGSLHEYRCKRFRRLEDGSGFCSAHDQRPNLCREFPYGRPVDPDEYPDCSWNVEIFGFEVGRTYRGTAGSYEVLWQSGPNVYVRLADGSERSLDYETEALAVITNDS
jgi:Fe-S-cluster containining protein